MSYMFHCWNINEIKFDKFNSENVKNMEHMLGGCLELSEINLSNFNTKNANYMGLLFSECRSLEKLDLSNLNTSIVQDRFVHLIIEQGHYLRDKNQITNKKLL